MLALLLVGAWALQLLGAAAAKQPLLRTICGWKFFGPWLQFVHSRCTVACLSVCICMCMMICINWDGLVVFPPDSYGSLWSLRSPSVHVQQAWLGLRSCLVCFGCATGPMWGGISGGFGRWATRVISFLPPGRVSGSSVVAGFLVLGILV